MTDDLLDAYEVWHFYRETPFTARQWARKFNSDRQQFHTSRRKWEAQGLRLVLQGNYYHLAPDYEERLSALLGERLPATGSGPESFLRRALAAATRIEQEEAL